MITIHQILYKADGNDDALRSIVAIAINAINSLTKRSIRIMRRIQSNKNL